MASTARQLSATRDVLDSQAICLITEDNHFQLPISKIFSCFIAQTQQLHIILGLSDGGFGMAYYDYICIPLKQAWSWINGL